MKWIRRIFGWISVVVVAVLLFGAFYVWRAMPAVDGSQQLPGLSAPVRIGRDASDLTHIRAQSAPDAWKALGYVHAQERGWQLEFNRRLMHGELSAIFGEATLETDKLLRTLGIVRAAQRQWEGLPAEGRQAMQAYSDGINAFYAQPSQALPPEFYLLGVKPGGASGQAWTPVDCLGWSLMMALDLGGNWGTEFARLSSAQVLDTAQLWQLFPPYPGEAPASSTDLSKLYGELGIYKIPRTDAIKTGAARAEDIRASGQFTPQNESRKSMRVAQDIAQWSADLGNPEGKGSNNWVLAGSHTQSGKPLLANDPHLGLSAPAIWYFARLQAPASTVGNSSSPALDVAGATLPGLPFVVLGHTAKVAWGFTNTGPDVQDLYLEQINPANPAQYRVPAAAGQTVWEEFETRKEVIEVKGKPDVSFTVRQSRHGPVLSDAQQSHGQLLDTQRYVLALRWSALDADNQTVLAGLRANLAQNSDELIAAFSVYHSPMQNVVVADTEGKVAYKAVGKVPIRRADNDIAGTAPAPGWDARYDWIGWLAYEQTPQASDAEISRKGWYASANQRITPPGYPHFLGQDWVVPYRYERIEQMLGAKERHDVASMQVMQADVLSGATLRLLPWLQKSLVIEAKNEADSRAREVSALLQNFDGAMTADSAAPLIFAAWIDELTRGVIGGKLGEKRFNALYGKRHFRSAMEGILERNDTWWCGSMGCTAQSQAALERALDRLEATYGRNIGRWRWGEAHMARSAHKPFSNVPALARFFDVAVPSAGDPFSINVGQYWAQDGKAPFTNRHAPSLRVIYDLADLDNSEFIYQTGQSGLVFSPRYRDMSRAWAEGRYRPLQTKQSVMQHELVLAPAF